MWCSVLYIVLVWCLLTWALCYCTLLVMINWWGKWVYFVKIKFQLNENIEWCCMQLEFRFNSIEFEFVNWIEFKFYWREMWCKFCVKHFENLLAIMVLQNNNFGYKQIWKEIFPFLLTWEFNKLSSWRSYHLFGWLVQLKLKSRALDKEVEMWDYWEQNTWKNWKEQNMR